MGITGAPGAGAERTSKMAIQRWDPVRDLIRLQETVNGLFEDVLGRSSSPGGDGEAAPGAWQPPLDLIEETGRYVVRADLPGVAPEEVDVLVEKGHLKQKLDGQRYVYRPKRSRPKAAQGALRRVVQTFLDGSVEQAVEGLLQSPDVELDEEQLDRIGQLIEKTRKEGR